MEVTLADDGGSNSGIQGDDGPRIKETPRTDSLRHLPDISFLMTERIAVDGTKVTCRVTPVRTMSGATNPDRSPKNTEALCLHHERTSARSHY